MGSYHRQITVQTVQSTSISLHFKVLKNYPIARITAQPGRNVGHWNHPPVSLGAAGSNPRNSIRRRRWVLTPYVLGICHLEAGVEVLGLESLSQFKINLLGLMAHQFLPAHAPCHIRRADSVSPESVSRSRRRKKEFSPDQTANKSNNYSAWSAGQTWRAVSTPLTRFACPRVPRPRTSQQDAAQPTVPSVSGGLKNI